MKTLNLLLASTKLWTSLAVALCVGGSALSSFAQTAKSRSALYTDADNALGDTGPEITPEDIRTLLKDVIASSYNPETDGEPGSGTGTLTDFSAGDLTGFFTTTETNTTTTPALSFTLASTSQNYVWAGPTSGSGAPSYRLLVAADIPSLSGIYQPLDSDLTSFGSVTPSANGLSLVSAANYSTMRGLLSLGNVENTALSTWAGSTNLTTLGTIATGIWQGTAIGDTYVSSATTWNAKQAGDAALTALAAGSDFVQFTGPATSIKQKILRDAADTILEQGGSYTPIGTWLWTSATATWPTFNQNTSGSAATLTTPRGIYGNNFDGSAALTQIIASTYGGTGNGFTKFTGPASAERTFTLPNADATLLYAGGPGSFTTVATSGATTSTFTGQTADTYFAGLSLINNTTAAASDQQHSPSIFLSGQGWKTTATAASQQVDWRITNVPVEGTTAPTSNLVFATQVNGGGYTDRFTFSRVGALSLSSGITTGSGADVTLTGGSLEFSGIAKISGGGSDGVLRLVNSTTTGFARLNFGLSTSSFVALQSSGTTLTVGTADGGTSAGSLRVAGILSAGSSPTTLTDSAGKILSAALNTVGVAQGGTGATTLTGIPKGNGTSAFTVAKADDLQSSQLVTLSSSSTDTYAGTAGVTATAYTAGTHYTFVSNFANTGAASLNIDGLGAKTIVKVAGGVTTTLADSDIRSGQVVDVVYDGTNLQLQSTLGNAASGGVSDGDKGDIAVASSGTDWQIDANSVALGTDTTGNYVATIADSGASEITVANSGSENAAVTLAIASSITRDTEVTTAMDDGWTARSTNGWLHAYWMSTGASANVASINGFSQTNSGTVGAVAATTTTPKAIDWDTAATTNSDAGSSAGGFDQWDLAHRTRFAVWIRLSSTADIRSWIGLTIASIGNQNTSDTPAQSHLAFRYSSGTDTNWVLSTRSASTQSTSDTGIAASTSWVLLAFDYNYAGGSVQAYINGVAAGSPITTNLPDATDMFNVVVGIRTKADAVKTIESASMDLWQKRL